MRQKHYCWINPNYNKIKSTSENKDNKIKSTSENKDNKIKSTSENKDNKIKSTTENKDNKIKSTTENKLRILSHKTTSKDNPKYLKNNIKLKMFCDADIEQENNKQFDSIFKVLMGFNSQLKNNNLKINNLKIINFDLNKNYTEIDTNIKSLDDLIKLTDIKQDKSLNYTIDIQKIINMKDILIELNNMVGMESVKKSVVKQIMYFLQGIEEQQDMLHMIITGSPGTGKTSLGIILAKLYHKMEIIESNSYINPLTGKKEEFKFKIYKRSDLIAQYLGQTAIKTQKAIDECSGGVMFLDEAYSLGHDDKSDIYTKECLDTINQNLSENKNKFILIIAGYPDQLDKCFFSHNEGLRRRFSFRYNIDKYTPIELTQILHYKINSVKWCIDKSIKDDQIIELINNSIELFDNFGGDIESWILHIKIEHGVRIFGKHPKHRKNINIDDFKNGLIEFRNAKYNNLQEIKKRDKERIQYMYS